MIWTSSAGASALSVVADTGVSLTIDARTESDVSPLNGRSPVAISYTITPSEKMSVR